MFNSLIFKPFLFDTLENSIRFTYGDEETMRHSGPYREIKSIRNKLINLRHEVADYVAQKRCWILKQYYYEMRLKRFCKHCNELLQLISRHLDYSTKSGVKTIRYAMELLRYRYSDLLELAGVDYV